MIETASVGTIADGIAVRVPVPEALAVMRTTVDDVLAGRRGRDARGDPARLRDAGPLVEPAGAVGLAALLAAPDLGRGQRVSTILCGGNVAPAQARDWLLEPP